MANKTGYKKTELGWIPDEWEVKKLGNVVKFSQGIQVDLELQANEYREGYLLFLRIENYTQSSNDFRYIPHEMGREKFVNEDDIVVVRYGASAGFIGKGFCGILANNLFKVDPHQEFILKSFLYIILKDVRTYQYFQNSMFGGAMPALSFQIAENLSIPLPPLPEQKKIAEILSTWDKAISNYELLITNYELLKKGLMQKLLTGKLRFKEFEGEKWKTVNLGEVTELFSRRNKKLNGARIYSVTNNNGFVFQSDHFSREVAGDDLSNYKIIKKNEFAYNPARINVGSIAHFKDEIGVISSLYVCFRTTKDLLDEYMSYLLQIDSTTFKIRNFGEGGVRVYLWYPLFATIKVNIPNIKEQKKIADSLLFLDKEIEILNNQLIALKEQKKGLMQKLLTGEVRVKIN